MAAVGSLRGSMQSIAGVVATAAGWSPGDLVIDDALGQIAQIGIAGGVRYVRPDPLVETALAQFNQQIIDNLLVVPGAGHTLAISGTIARQSGDTPPGPGIIYVSCQLGGAIAVLSAVAVGAGCTLLQLILNAGSDNAMAVLSTDSLTGVWGVTFTAAAGANAVSRIWTNADCTAAQLSVIV